MPSVSCSCLTRSSNSVARADAGGMGRPQLGLPRVGVWATGITIGPDHTPRWVTPRQILSTGVPHFRLDD